MARAHHHSLEQLSAPVIAWLIDNGSVVDLGGLLDVTPYGRSYLRETVLAASRATKKPHPEQAPWLVKTTK